MAHILAPAIFKALFQDAEIACRAHHIAAERCNRLNIFLGPPCSLLLLLLSLYLLGVKEGIFIKEYREGFGLLVGFLAATIGGISNLYNFKEDLLRHKFAAERYNTLCRLVVEHRLAEDFTRESFRAISNEFSHIQHASPSVSNSQFKKAARSVQEIPVGGPYPLDDKTEPLQSLGKVSDGDLKGQVTSSPERCDCYVKSAESRGTYPHD